MTEKASLLAPQLDDSIELHIGRNIGRVSAQDDAPSTCNQDQPELLQPLWLLQCIWSSSSMLSVCAAPPSSTVDSALLTSLCDFTNQFVLSAAISEDTRRLGLRCVCALVYRINR